MNANDSPGSGVPPTPVYVAPPPEGGDDRPRSAWLILVVNLILLAAAILFAVSRYKGGAASVTHSDVATGTTAKGGAESPSAKPDPVDVYGEMDKRATTGKAGETAPGAARPIPGKKPRPVFDAETQRKWTAAQTALSRIGVQMEVLRARTGRYPTSAVADNGANRGIEALLKALRDAGRDKEIDGTILSIGDTDGDGKDEILDPWGHPLVYFSEDDYGSTQSWGKENVEVGAARVGQGELPAYKAKSRYQLWSAGPNGRLFTPDAANEDETLDDDIVSWEIRELVH